MTPNRIKEELFWWLVNRHYTVNLLGECLPNIKGGMLYDSKGNPLQEGSDKRVPYDGVLIMANGSTLIDKLKQDGVVHDETPGDFVNILNEEDFQSYLTEQQGEDGAYILDSNRGIMVSVAEINNKIPLPSKFSLTDMIPCDFLSSNGSSKKIKIGTKTRLAIKFPHAYENTEAYQIKRSPYGHLKMGKVTHFTNKGLFEEFFFMYGPTNKGPFVAPEIIGVHRQYNRINDKLIKTLERQINRSEIGY